MKLRHKWLLRLFCGYNDFKVEYDTMNSIMGGNQEMIVLHRKTKRTPGGAH